jgi:hypothetical protein
MKYRLQLGSRNSFMDTQASEHFSGPAIFELKRADGRTDKRADMIYHMVGRILPALVNMLISFLFP